MKIKSLIFIFFVCQSSICFSQPIVIEGAVPDEHTKSQILRQMHDTYGQANVVDKIRVKVVTTPTNWSESVVNLIRSDIKNIRHGQLKIQGTEVNLHGKVSTEQEIKNTTASVKNSLAQNFRLKADLSLNHAEQDILDDALKNRIIEFESGSAVLTATGTSILDEMAVALKRLQNKQVKIIGHTDSQGEANKNMRLSEARAQAVKDYLIVKKIAEQFLKIEGLGSTRPVADNATAEGRKKNRRIEFSVM